MNMEGEAPCRCVECGQAFRLVKALLPDSLNDPNTRSGGMHDESHF